MNYMMEKVKETIPRSIRMFIVGIKNGIERYFIPEHKWGYIDRSVKLDVPITVQGYKNVFLYENSHIGPHSIILATNAKFILKKYSGSAGGLCIVTGNHVRLKGRFYRTIRNSEKPKNFDKDVIINEDVWMGLNVTILSGVEIGRGTTVAAGAVVTKSTPPYCIVGGVPAKVLKFYWTIDEIIEHEKSLYPEHERYTRVQLEEIIRKFRIKHAWSQEDCR